MVHPYADPIYANAFGLPVLDVPEWGTPVLAREIPGTNWFDAAGCYPLTAFGGDIDLFGGLARLREAGAVSVMLVPDPITAPDADDLAAAFPVCRPFKTHYLIDRDLPPPQLGAAHRYNMRRARARCDIRVVRLSDHLDVWVAMYGLLIERRLITGAAAFGRSYFEALAAMPALTMVAAFQEDVMIAGSLWLHAGEVAYYHLGASLPAGYRAQAMYGIVATAIDVFENCRFVHFGGAAGQTGAENDGLAFFKRGFCNTERPAYLCGAVLDRDRYEQLSVNIAETAFFPRYRAAVAGVSGQ